ncbi:MAG TPA: hypothetical protein VJ184_00630 [Chryseolinea sp.]|nr:hypothetical protein [Chryseolinea sp.]
MKNTGLEKFLVLALARSNKKVVVKGTMDEDGSFGFSYNNAKIEKLLRN